MAMVITHCNGLHKALNAVPKNLDGSAGFAVENVDCTMVTSLNDDLAAFSEGDLLGDVLGRDTGGEVSDTLCTVCVVETKPISNVVDGKEVPPVVEGNPAAVSH